MSRLFWKRKPLFALTFTAVFSLGLLQFISRRESHNRDRLNTQSSSSAASEYRKHLVDSKFFSVNIQQQPIDQQVATEPFNSFGGADSSEINRPCGPHLEYNQHFVDRNYWQSIKPELLTQKRQEWKAFLQHKIPLFVYDRFKYQGRGVVYTATGQTLSRAMASIRLLHMLGCQLPIQIWHIRGELSDVNMKEIQQLPGSVQVKDILEEQAKWEEFQDYRVGHEYGSSRNYHIKTLVLLLCEFREILYLDSDNMPLQDPTVLFNSPEYFHHRTLFWPDFWKFPFDNPMWTIMERPCEDEWEQESGQLVVDKKVAWNALLLSLYLQRDHDFYFRIILGDKDTFRFSWKATNTPYLMVPHPVAIGGRVRQGRFCGHTMIQHSVDGSLLFAHTTSLKSTNAIRLGNTWEAIQYYEPAEPVLQATLSTVDGMSAYVAGYPRIIEYQGGLGRSKEDGGAGQDLISNPCLELSIVNATVHTFNSVIDRLGGVGRAVDSYRVITESFATYGRGNLSWLEPRYYEFGGPGSGTIEYCGGGVRGAGVCRNADECCSSWGFCGMGVDYCGVGCVGGGCYRTRVLPAEPSPDFKFCGGGSIGYGLCAEGSCCSRFGWCGRDKGYCGKSNCVSGPCLDE